MKIYELPSINANELRDLSVQHFSKEGADMRSLQTLRQVKQLRRLQALKESDFDRLTKKFQGKDTAEAPVISKNKKD